MSDFGLGRSEDGSARACAWHGIDPLMGREMVRSLVHLDLKYVAIVSKRLGL